MIRTRTPRARARSNASAVLFSVNENTATRIVLPRGAASMVLLTFAKIRRCWSGFPVGLLNVAPVWGVNEVAWFATGCTRSGREPSPPVWPARIGVTQSAATNAMPVPERTTDFARDETAIRPSQGGAVEKHQVRFHTADPACVRRLPGPVLV